MKKKNIFDKSFWKIVLLAICIFVSYRLVFDFEGVSAGFMGVISFFLNLLGYFVWGFSIAFILNQIVLFFQKVFKFIKSENVKRILSVATAYIVALGFIVLFFVAIIPVIGNSVSDLVSNIPTYAEKLTEMYGSVQTYLQNQFGIQVADLGNIDYVEILTRVSDFVLNGENIGALTHWLFETTNVVMNFLFGFIISIYMLLDKEKFLQQTGNIVDALLPEKWAERLRVVGKRANELFAKFLFGKLIDSTIIGIIAYIAFLIIGVRYPLLLAFIVGITNIIPYFGPIVGGVVACAIVLFTNSGISLFIISAIMVLALQQLDGWVIGPRILHGQIGVSPLLIIAGVTIGGSLAGFIGMVIGVPLLALLKELFYDGYVMKKLQVKKAKSAVETTETEDNDGLA